MPIGIPGLNDRFEIDSSFYRDTVSQRLRQDGYYSGDVSSYQHSMFIGRYVGEDNPERFNKNDSQCLALSWSAGFDPEREGVYHNAAIINRSETHDGALTGYDGPFTIYYEPGKDRNPPSVTFTQQNHWVTSIDYYPTFSKLSEKEKFRVAANILTELEQMHGRDERLSNTDDDLYIDEKLNVRFAIRGERHSENSQDFANIALPLRRMLPMSSHRTTYLLEAPHVNRRPSIAQMQAVVRAEQARAGESVSSDDINQDKAIAALLHVADPKGEGRLISTTLTNRLAQNTTNSKALKAALAAAGDYLAAHLGHGLLDTEVLHRSGQKASKELIRELANLSDNDFNAENILKLTTKWAHGSSKGFSSLFHKTPTSGSRLSFMYDSPELCRDVVDQSSLGQKSFTDLSKAEKATVAEQVKECVAPKLKNRG